MDAMVIVPPALQCVAMCDAIHAREEVLMHFVSSDLTH